MVDRITDRIRALGTKKLSYAGRVVLIKSVLNVLHNYWARIFILPKTILSKLKESPSLVAWANSGGLGFKHLHNWNVAAIAKYAWWVAKKADHLWVKWVHAYRPGYNASWSWRKICWVKDQLWPVINKFEYSIKKGYQFLYEENAQVYWFPWVKNRCLIPKHSFLIWLVVQQRLLTQDRLMHMEIIQTNLCFLCATDAESHEHLFFSCVYARKCLELLNPALDVKIPVTNVFKWWLRWRERSRFIKLLVATGVASLMYNNIMYTPCFLCQVVVNDVKNCARICVVA
ncbi:hypothetical protein RND81_02G219400 [Saponaria officinalis]|uniref:Reverse transcriptase zinc-binding domain-containing protein n=1 Tax=Saponaria officinalis TaxID=3572 RepID=A0AAW1MXF4_SAPOF